MRSQSGFRTGPLPPLNWWSFALMSPLLQSTAGSSSATIYETDSAYRMHHARGEELTGIYKEAHGWKSVLVHLVPRKGPDAAHHSFPPCWSLMATQTRSSSRESSVVRSVMAQVGASWGCSPGRSAHGWRSCAARAEGLCSQQTAPVRPSVAETDWCFLVYGFPCWWWTNRLWVP